LIKKLRLEKGLEQRELAGKIGVSGTSVYNWENDRKRPSRKSMERLVKFFKISRKKSDDYQIEKKKAL